jgi:hypothetical protein
MHGIVHGTKLTRYIQLGRLDRKAGMIRRQTLWSQDVQLRRQANSAPIKGVRYEISF